MKHALAARFGLVLGALCQLACSVPAPAPLELGSHTAALLGGQVRWEKRAVTVPPARMAHALIYDSARQRTLAVGGRLPNDSGSSLDDTWAWDGQSWSQLSAGFENRGFIQGTFDSSRQTSVIYGGIQTLASAYSAETWERTTGMWNSRAGTPGARSTVGLAYDSARHLTMLFGGFNGAWLSDLWEWDGQSWSERCNSGACSSNPRPSRRAALAFSYDEARQEALLFGGFDSTSSDNYLGDTWTWNGNSWTQHSTPTAPNPRTSASLAYDPVSQTTYLFGGTNGVTEFDDLWAWDGDAWQELASQGGPSRRRDARLVWDTARRRGVLFGGRAQGQAVDFWELSLVGNACSSDDDCHTGVCESLVCVDSPVLPPEPPDAGQGGASGGSGGSAGAGSAGAGSSAAGAGAAGASAGRAGVDSSGGDADAGSFPDTQLESDDPGRAPVDPAVAGKSLYACSMGEGTAPRGSPTALLACGVGLFLRRRRS